MGKREADRENSAAHTMALRPNNSILSNGGNPVETI
jgi:hypothetical protein